MADLKISDAVQLYLANRDALEALKKKYDADKKVIDDQQKLLEAYFQEQMNTLGVKNLPTEFGTPYTSTISKFKITNREAFLAWVKQNDAFDVFSSSVTKEPVLAYMNANDGALPPGLEMSQVVNVNVKVK